MLRRTHTRASWMPKFVPDSSYVLYLEGQNDAYGSVIRDKSSYQNDVTLTTPTWKRNSKGLWYLDFNGTSDYLRPGDDVEFDITTAISCGTWVNLDAVGAINQVMNRDDGTARNFQLYIAADATLNFSIYTGDAGKPGETATTVSALKWHLVGGSYDKVTVRAYMDGVKGTTTETVATTNIDNDDVPLEIGSKETAGGGSANRLAGGIALPFLRNVNMTDADWSLKFAQERHLFGV